MTAEGKYLAKSAKGATVYNPKARFVKSPGGTERTLMNSQARVPTKIRPKMTRKTRSNRGTSRGTRAGVHAGNLARLYSPMAKRPAGRPRKHLVSPKAAYGIAGLFKSMGMGPVKRRYMATRARKIRKARKTA